MPDLHYSVEGHFPSMANSLPADIEAIVEECPKFSVGVLPRMVNMVHAALHQRDVNHVAGDVHYLTFLLRKRRTLLTVLDCGSAGRRASLRQALFELLWFRIPAQRSALVSTISDFTKGEFVRMTGCDPRRIRVVPVSVSPVFRRNDRPFRLHRPVILAVGTSDNKNLLRLCAAVEGVDCHLHIIGKLSGAQRAALHSHGVDFRNSFRLCEGDLVEAYNDCDLVAFVSTYEGFGMPIIEAQAVGRPVVAGNVASMPEVAADGACLADPLSIPSIRQGLLRVINDAEYRYTLREAGFRNVERFGAERIARMYSDIYRELALR